MLFLRVRNGHWFPSSVFAGCFFRLDPEVGFPCSTAADAESQEPLLSLKENCCVSLGWVNCPKRHFQKREINTHFEFQKWAVFSSSTHRRCPLLDTGVAAGTCLGSSLSVMGVTGGTKSCS